MSERRNDPDPYAGEDAPCKPADGSSWRGQDPCTLDFGLCVVCGQLQGLPWAAMSHEEYGAWWVAEAWRRGNRKRLSTP